MRSGDRRLWWVLLGLSLGPAVSNGFARFSYGLILPSMREDLGWSYTQAGWINTANAIGYLLGALLALALVSRLGPRRLFIWGMALTTVAIAYSATTRDFWMLTLWRVVAGIGGAPVFIAGGAMASAMFVESRSKNALAIAVYFGGGGMGMLLTALALPPFLAWFGATGWPLAWLMLGIGCFLAFIPSDRAARAAPEPERPGEATGAGPLPVRSMAPALTTYFLFGLGYLIYVTFLIEWMRIGGAGVWLVVQVWAVMGIAVMASPFAWSWVLARARGGLALSLTSLATGAGILLPLTIEGPEALLASAALFGLSFFMVPTAATTFGRKNLSESQWGPALSLFTTIFAIGQILGPVGGGVISDLSGGPEPGLVVAGLILLSGAAVALAQRPLRHD